MNLYQWRDNFTAYYSDHEKTIKGKLAFKSKKTNWLDTLQPIVILVSVHSAFNEDVQGDLKMNAFISIIKKHVRGKITILISESAHLHTMSLDYEENLEVALEICVNDAKSLVSRYQSYFEGCHVAYWHSYICQDERFDFFLNSIDSFYQRDPLFRKLVDENAAGTYSNQFQQKYINRDLFIQKAKKDILKQCASLFVLANRGYRFQFYPGKPYSAIEYVGLKLIPEEDRLDWIDIFLAIEKKRTIELTLP